MAHSLPNNAVTEDLQSLTAHVITDELDHLEGLDDASCRLDFLRSVINACSDGNLCLTGPSMLGLSLILGDTQNTMKTGTAHLPDLSQPQRQPPEKPDTSSPETARGKKRTTK
jgi:hypothetical protein